MPAAEARAARREAPRPQVIPIIKRFPDDAIYDGLPVLRLENGFDDGNVTADRLLVRDELALMFEPNSTRRSFVVVRLLADYLWTKVRRAAEAIT